MHPMGDKRLCLFYALEAFGCIYHEAFDRRCAANRLTMDCHTLEATATDWIAVATLQCAKERGYIFSSGTQFGL